MNLLPTIALSIVALAVLVGAGNIIVGSVMLAWEWAMERIGL